MTILTPSYNRRKNLPELYKSLCNQTVKDFEWLIIDDGSSDNTSELINSLTTNDFRIRYKYKENGGKHTAINFGLQYVFSELVMIVDSDDFLTDNAVELIIATWEHREKKKNIANMIFLKRDTQNRISGFEFEKDYFVNNYNEYILSNPLRAESADVWKTKILKQYPYPVFIGEKYVAETTVWSKIARSYDTLFVNQVIYIFEYQEDGLTNSGRKMRLKSPNGSMENALVIMESNISMKLNLKNMLLFITYGNYSGEKLSNLYKRVPYKILFIISTPFAILLSKYWKMKYGD